MRGEFSLSLSLSLHMDEYNSCHSSPELLFLLSLFCSGQTDIHNRGKAHTYEQRYTPPTLGSCFTSGSHFRSAAFTLFGDLLFFRCCPVSVYHSLTVPCVTTDSAVRHIFPSCFSSSSGERREQREERERERRVNRRAKGETTCQQASNRSR